MRGPLPATPPCCSRRGKATATGRRPRRCWTPARTSTPPRRTAPPRWWSPRSDGIWRTPSSSSTAGADPDLGPGFTPLHWAAGKWDTELNDLSNGVAEGNQWSAFGGLHAPDRLRMVRLLLAHGGDPDVRTRRTPGFGIQVKGHLGNMREATAFVIAAKANDVAVMRELLDHGADPFIATSNGTTPLMVAAGVGHAPGITRSAEGEALQAVHLCVELGADVNAVNEAGDTALHGAAWRERADSIVQFLVDRGAELDAKNDRNWTPLVIAEGIHTGGNFIKSDTTAVLLRRLGAAPSPPDILREPDAR